MPENVFDALSNVHRRRLLVTLLTTGLEGVSLEHDPRETPTDGGYEYRRIELYHTHLPMLEEYGYISWNRETETVTKGSQFETIERMLTVLHDNRTSLPMEWSDW